MAANAPEVEKQETKIIHGTAACALAVDGPETKNIHGMAVCVPAVGLSNPLMRKVIHGMVVHALAVGKLVMNGNSQNRVIQKNGLRVLTNVQKIYVS